MYNGQGNVIEILDSAGSKVAQYTYNAWGLPLSVKDGSGNIVTSATHIANLNPFRYRGYYYDTESGFYYLQSRYYDPQTCRFINADAYVSTGQGVLGTNVFAYCGNNPVLNADYSGEFFGTVIGIGLLVTGMIFFCTSSKNMSKAVSEPNSTNNKSKVIGANKSQNERPDSGLRDVPDDEISKRAKDKSLPGQERKRYQREEKVRGLRNKQKRESKISPYVDEPKPGIVIDDWQEVGSGVVATGTAITAGYLIYRGLRILPSLLPPLWWTLPANAACP